MKHSHEDEYMIRQIIDGLDNAVDAKDWARARNYFTETIFMDFSSMGGGNPAEGPADNLIGSWEQNLFAGKKSFHLRTNHDIQVNGDTASDYSKAYAINALDAGPVTGIWEIWADYIYTLVREGESWKITGMTVIAVQTRGDDAVRTYTPGS